MPSRHYTTDDFAFDLRANLAPPAHLSVGSGFSTAAPQSGTVAGVRSLYAPPLFSADLRLGVELVVEGHRITDTGSTGKGDVGLLYAGGRWFPDRVVRDGTYHHMIEGKLLSLAASTGLVPLPNDRGFVETVRVTNRSGRPVEVLLDHRLDPGCPLIVVLRRVGLRPSRAVGWSRGQHRRCCLGERGRTRHLRHLRHHGDDGTPRRGGRAHGPVARAADPPRRGHRPEHRHEP